MILLGTVCRPVIGVRRLRVHEPQTHPTLSFESSWHDVNAECVGNVPGKLSLLLFGAQLQVRRKSGNGSRPGCVVLVSFAVICI